MADAPKRFFGLRLLTLRRLARSFAPFPAGLGVVRNKNAKNRRSGAGATVFGVFCGLSLADRRFFPRRADCAEILATIRFGRTFFDSVHSGFL
jgi:hypothetical protein